MYFVGVQRWGRPHVGAKRQLHISFQVGAGCCAPRIAHMWHCDIKSLVRPAEKAPQERRQPILSLSLVFGLLTIG